MSSSRPEYTIFLSDPPDIAKKKLMAALTGGRPTAEEQRRLGGNPDKCTVFDLYVFGLIQDDKELEKIREECTSGKLLCGKCKKIAWKLLEERLKDFQEKIGWARELAWKIVDLPSF
jgi:tryptophanyl-tRNA synthetase